MAVEPKNPVLSVRDIHVSFGPNHVLKGLDLDAYRGEIIGFVGGSGTGKSVLMRTILGLCQKQAGTIKLFGLDYDQLDDEQRSATDRRTGVLFQHGALFSALTVKENIQMPMREYLSLSQTLMDELAAMKLSLVGLPMDATDKYPSELSGGMIKRASLARALALDPELLFLDEPTSGLDPIGAAEFDELTVSLSRTLGLTVFMVTHDLGSLHAICDRIAVLKDGKVLAIDTLERIEKLDDPWVRSYFGGQRAISAQHALRTGSGMVNARIEG
ncbi:ABC transporter ATP-binding protein [Pseudahrensia aquimaris]|uniref:ABC transporter ATP-binding protein n=1 Tax=Pseudahrensia aquimaris TaxID=744461 RepID=A0ABW3FJ52_9HYPH